MSRVIYALVDPRDGKPFYVGQTCDPGARLSGHLSENSNSAKAHRINEIKAAGFIPEMNVLERAPTDPDAAEIAWVKRISDSGCYLTNSLRVLGLAKLKERRQFTIRLNDAARKQMKFLALEEGRSVHDIMIDALNDYFCKLGKPPIASYGDCKTP